MTLKNTLTALLGSAPIALVVGGFWLGEPVLIGLAFVVAFFVFEIVPHLRS